MTTHTFGNVLPLFGASAPLLTAAVGRPYPSTLTKLAHDAGISKFAASRAATQLIDTGLLTLDPDGYELNDDHPMTPLITQLAWRFSGVVRTRRRVVDNGRRSGLDYYYRYLVPEFFHSHVPDVPELEGMSGPDLVTARDTCDWLGERAATLARFDRNARDVHDLWGTERLRDMVHQTQHFGGVTALARNTLIAACSWKAQGDQDPYTVGVKASTWVRSTYLLSAEVRDILRVIKILDRAVWVAGRVNKLRSDAVYHLHEVNHAGRGSEYAAQWLEKALEAEREADALWTDPGYGEYKNIGGTPQVVDVGTAGDQVMAVQLLRAIEELAAQVAVMAQHQCVQEWNALHPEEAKRHALVTKVPTGVLRGARDYPKDSPRAGAAGIYQGRVRHRNVQERPTAPGARR